MTDAVREELATLELAYREAEQQAETSRSRVDELLSRMTTAEKTKQELRTEIKQKREELAREEAREASLEQAQEVSDEQARYVERFTRIGQDKAWWGDGPHPSMDDEQEGILNHQWHGAMFGAVARRWILGDGVGLGKTRTSIAWLDLVAARKVVLICQPDICDQFAGELSELAPHRTVANIYNKTRERRHEILDTITSMDEGVVIANFEVWRRDNESLAKLMEWQADTVVVDEAHNLKTTSTANFKYVKALVMVDNKCPKCGGLMRGLFDTDSRAKKPCLNCGWIVGEPTAKRFSARLDQKLSTKSVKNFMGLTGTPILNDPVDFYSLLHLCDPILFDTKANFIKTFCTKNYHSDKYEWRGQALNMLYPLIQGRYLARTREEVGIEVPKQERHVIPVELDPKKYPLQYRTIKQISEAAMIQLESGESITIMHLIALITRKRQANVWPGGIEIRDTDKDSPTYGEVLFSVGDEVQESAKMDAILENIEELHAEGRRQVVFSQFKTGLAELEKRIAAKGIRVVRLDGDTPKQLRAQIKSNFYRAKGETPKWDVLLANYKTGGTGLNLTAATAVHIMDEEWNPGKRDQAYGRTDRMGQIEEGDIFVYRIPGTVDTWMANTIKRKEQIISQFNETMEGVHEELTPNVFLDAMKNGDIL